MKEILTNDIYILVCNVLNTFLIEEDKKIDVIDNSTRLIGSSSQLDSFDLVQIIVEIEDAVNSVYATTLVLTDEKAMSRTTSPFVNVETLVKFIIERLNE